MTNLEIVIKGIIRITDNIINELKKERKETEKEVNLIRKNINVVNLTNDNFSNIPF